MVNEVRSLIFRRPPPIMQIHRQNKTVVSPRPKVGCLKPPRLRKPEIHKPVPNLKRKLNVEALSTHAINTPPNRRKRPRNEIDPEYVLEPKKKRSRKNGSKIITRSSTDAANFAWRETSEIYVPDIVKVDIQNWRSEDDDPNVGKEDLSNIAYFLRHYRAEKREKIFYTRLQEWRKQEKREYKNRESDKTLRVIERPRGPWQTNIPTETLEIPNDVNVEGIIRFNYVPNAVWPPENLIRLAKDGDMSILEESSPKVGGKDLRYEKYRQDHLDATC